MEPVIRFLTGTEPQAIPIRYLLQIRPDAAYHAAAPGAPAGLLGMVQEGDAQIPVVDLAARIGLAPAPRRMNTRLLLVNPDGNDPIALRTASVGHAGPADGQPLFDPQTAFSAEELATFRSHPAADRPVTYEPPAEATTIERPCWESIGVEGDLSCPTLASLLLCRNCDIYQKGVNAVLDRAPATHETFATAPAAEPPPTRIALIPFLAEDVWLALPTTAFESVCPATRPHRLPDRNPSHVPGIVNVEGDLLPCLSIHPLLPMLGISPRPPVPGIHRLLILRHGEERWALQVQEVSDILWRTAPVKPRDDEDKLPLVLGIVPETDPPMRWLDAPAFFTYLRFVAER